MRFLLALLVAAAALALAACGGSDSSEAEATTESSAATSAAETASTGASAGSGAEAPCTKEAIEAGLRGSYTDEPFEVLGFECKDGWAAGPILVGPPNSDEQYEAAYLVQAKDGAWTVPAELPCDDSSVPEEILDRSPCRVS